MCQSAITPPLLLTFHSKQELKSRYHRRAEYYWYQCCIHLQGKSDATAVWQFAPSSTSPACTDPLFIVIAPDYRTDHSSHIFVTVAPFEMHLRSSCYNAWSLENVAPFSLQLTWQCGISVFHIQDGWLGILLLWWKHMKKWNTCFRCLYVHIKGPSPNCLWGP